MNLALVIGGLAACAAAIAWVGVRTARLGDRLADRTGLGEALVGAVFIGATTSLPGSIASIYAAAGGHPSLAVANGIGGIAAQTAFLAVADIAYRRANLEHAAASPENLSQCALLIVLLGIVLVTMMAPPAAPLGVNPASVALVAAYIFGIRLVAQTRREGSWRPAQTDETRPDAPDDTSGDTTPASRLWLVFAGLTGLLAVSGFAIAQLAIALVQMTGLSETVIGALVVAVGTSLPELVIAVSAVRQGALTLAVGNIIGGNCFDVLFLAMSDVAYRDGSIYHAIAEQDRFVVALTVLMAGIVLLGLVRREKHGVANIGFESVLVLAAYGGGVALIAAM